MIRVKVMMAVAVTVLLLVQAELEVMQLEEMAVAKKILALLGQRRRRLVEQELVLPCIPVVTLLMATGMELLVCATAKVNGLARVVKRSTALTMTKQVASQTAQRMACVSWASAFALLVGAWLQAALE